MLTATQASDASYAQATATASLDVEKEEQAISFDALPVRTYGDGAFGLSAVSTSGLAISYSSSDETVATVSGSTVTILGAGTTNIIATQTGNDDYKPAIDISRTLTVTKQSQSVTFAVLDAQTYGDVPFTVSATGGGSGNAVTFSSSDNTVVTVSGNTVTVIGAGTCTIYAHQAGNANYSAAPEVGRVLTVGKSDQTISFEALADKTYGDAAFNLAATSTSALGLSYVSSNTDVATISGNTVTIIGAGTTSITAIQTGNSNYNAASPVVQSLTVDKSDQTITFNVLDGKTFGDAAFDLTGRASSELTVSYTSSNEDIATVSGSTVSIVGAGTTIITALQPGDGNYNAAVSVSRPLTVANQAQSIVFEELPAKTYGDVPFTVSATGGGSGNPVIFTSSDASIATCSGTNGSTITIVGAGTCTINANQAGNVDYSAALFVGQPLTVEKADQIISFNPLENKVAGDENFAISALASSELTVTFTSSDESVAICSGINGTTVTIVGVGNCIIYANQAGNANFNSAPAVEQGLTVFKYITGDIDRDGEIADPEIVGDKNGDGTITDPEIAGDINGDGTITDPEIAGDINGDGTITDPEIAGDINGDGTITDPEITGDKNGDGKITDPEIAGDTNGDGTITDPEIAGDINGDGTITDPEIAGDINGDGQITDPEITGDKNGDGKTTDPEIAGDTNGDGTITDPEIAGDINGDGTITDPEIAGDINGDGTITDPEITGDKNGDGKITDPEIAGDTNGDGTITDPEIAGDTNGDGKITDPEITGDKNGDGQITEPEITGDKNGDGKIADPEIAGDKNGDGTITDPEIAGDTNGDGKITDPEITGDKNGDGQITEPEITGDKNGDGKITDPEIAGDTNGDGKITDPEIMGDTNGDGQIGDGEVAGDSNGDGQIGDGETAIGTTANISVLTINGAVFENPDDEIYYLIDCGDNREYVSVSLTLEANATSPHLLEFGMEIPGPGLYREIVPVISADGTNTRTYRITIEKRFDFENIVIQKYNNVLLINNNPETNGGYHFTAFNWYKDSQLIGTGQYYSAGDNTSDQLDLNAMYSVEMETEDGDVLRTCEFTATYSNIFSLKVAPNPVVSGSTIDVTTTYTTAMLADLKITVRNLYGAVVMQERSGNNNSRITLPSSLTPGTYVVTTKAGGVELSTKIVVQ